MSVPQPLRGEGKLEINTKAKNLCVYTLKITANEKNFPIEQQSFIEKIRNLAIDIHCMCWEANNIKVGDNQQRYERRLELQAEAADKCNTLSALIDISKSLFHLSSRKVIYWTELVIELRNKIRSWHDSDAKRLKPSNY